MKGYWFAIEWVAENDEPTDTDLESIRGYISVGLVADIWNKSTQQVAEDILSYREDNLPLRYYQAMKRERNG